MVVHIGIDPLNGKVAVYDTDAEIFKKFDIVVEKVTSGDIGKVKKLFLSIKNQLNQDIGNACVCLDENYENDIRLEFVKQATENGVYLFEIIDVNTLLFFYAASQDCDDCVDYDVFWILWSRKVFIFLQKNEKVFFVKAYPAKTKTDIATIKKLKQPKVFFMQSDDNVIAEELCPSYICNNFYYGIFKIEDVALSRARLVNSENQSKIVVSCFGRKCELLLNNKPILTILPDVHLPYEQVVEIDGNEDNHFLKIIENGANIKTFTFNKQSLLFNISSNGIYYLSEISNAKTNNSDLAGSKMSKNANELPPVPTAAKPGINAMLSKLKVSQDFNIYSDLIRQLGFIQTQISIIQPLTILSDFLSLTEKDSNFEELEPIISILDDSFKNLQLKCQELSDTNIMYDVKIKGITNSIISRLKNIRQNFDENIIYWYNIKEFREKCASEIAWIESTQTMLSSWKSISSQNYPKMKEFSDNTKLEMEKHDVEVKEFFAKTMKEIHEITQYEVFAHEYYNKWNALKELYKGFAIDIGLADKAHECLEKNKIITERKNKLTEDASNSIKNSEDIKIHETYVQELKAIENEARNIKKELKQQKSEINSYNARASDFSIFESNFEEAIYDMTDFCDDVMVTIEKEKEIIRMLSDFNESYEALKSWINEQYLLLSSTDMCDLTESRNGSLSTIYAIIETKKIQMAEIKEKGATLMAKGVSSIIYKITEIQTLWNKFLQLLSDKNAEMNNAKKFLEKIEVINHQINSALETSSALNERSGLEEILNKMAQLNDNIIDVENMADSLKNECSNYADQVDACVKKFYNLQKVLDNNVLNAAKHILADDLSVPTIYSMSQLHQYFATLNDPTSSRNHLSPKLKRFSKLDESFRSFWQNRENRQLHHKESIDNTYDNNWLKRMSKMPKFDIPQKYNAYNTKINAVGIDLGTSSCCVAVNRENRIEAAAIDNTGERTLPSYVGFDEPHVKCGKVVVNRLGSFSKCTIFDSKRLIGKKYEEIEKDPTWPFDILEAGENIQLSVHGHSNTMITKTPEEIATILLKHLKQKAEEFQGKGITKAVVTIPAAFTENQKETTLIAAKNAGLEDVSLLPEPVAASFAYFIDRPLPQNATILLFDLGGGTLDICIFEINNSEFQIIRNTGDANIGGRNFDKILYEYFKTELFSRHNINLETNERRKYKLMLKCQEIKHMLSARDDDGIDVDDFDANIDGPPINITRYQFESLCAKLIEDIKILLKYAVDSLQQPVEKVLHVGGSSRLPMIKAMLETMFPDAEHCCEEQPEEVVAIGAAYYSYHLAFNQING